MKFGGKFGELREDGVGVEIEGEEGGEGGVEGNVGG